MKTPEEMAYDYGEKFDGVEISKNDINIAWYEGYKAAQDQLADADKVMPDTCEHILDMGKMVDVNGWISVKDRLPEIGEWVLINGPEVCQRIEPPSASWKAEYAWNTDHESFYYPEDITHWMPLPEPPKEEE
jgi:hypothetical protein